MKKYLWLIGLGLVLLPASPALAMQKQLFATGDVLIDRNQPTRNFNGDFLEVAARTNFRETLIKFNAANGIPRNSTVNRAYLKLYTWGDGCYGNINSMDVKAVRAISSWDERTATYNNSPDTTTSGMSSHAIPMRDDTRYEIWDVTSIVKAWVEQGKPDYGFKLYYYNGSVECTASFFSRDNGGSTQMPLLAIDYTPQVNLRDVVAPVISNANVEHLSTTAVDIHWTTNEAATTKVEFGTGNNYDRSSPAYTGYRTSHIARVDQLQQATAYNYRIISVDAAGNRAVLDNQTFTTARDGSQPHSNPSSNPTTPTPSSGSSGGQSGVQLHIQNIISDVTGPTTAKIKWYSRPTGTSWVFVSATANSNAPISEYGEPQGQNDDVEIHEVGLRGLQPSTTYGYRVATRTTDNQWAVSEQKKFTTLNTQSSASNSSSSSASTSEETTGQDETGYSADSQNEDNNINSQEVSTVKKEVAMFLGETTPDTENKNAVKKAGSNENISGKFDQPVPKLVLALWVALRMLVPLIIFLALIIFFIFWLKRRKKKENKPTTPNGGNDKNLESQHSIETEKKTKNIKILFVIILTIALLLIWRLASLFFPFL